MPEPPTDAPDTAQWFDQLGYCAGNCGRWATGTLRDGHGNACGIYCTLCGERRLRAAYKERRRLRGIGE